MKLVRWRTLGAFGLGFLAGSRAGRGPWEKAQTGMNEVKDRVTGMTDGDGAMSPDGIKGQRGGQGSPQLTEM